MTETVILAAGQTAGTSSDVVVSGGSSATITIIAAGGFRGIPGNISLPVYKVDNGIESVVYSLSRRFHAQSFGPGTFRVKRGDISAYGVDVSVTSST